MSGSMPIDIDEFRKFFAPKQAGYNNVLNTVDPSDQTTLFEKLGEMNVTPDIYNQMSQDEQLQLIDNLKSDGAFNKGLFGQNIFTNKNISTGLGLGQLALGIASYIDNKKANKAKLGLMNQEMANNKEVMDAWKDKRAGIAESFATV